MWLKKQILNEKTTGAPEKLRYSRYYEHDGALRAYANRAMVLAFICVPTALLAVAMAAYVRLQPPTVIRVDVEWLRKRRQGGTSAQGQCCVPGQQTRNPTTLKRKLMYGYSWSAT